MTYNLKKYIFYSLVLFSYGFSQTSIQAEDFLEGSGYYGFITRVNLGIAYSELAEDYGRKEKVFGLGPLASLNVGWAFAGNYAVHVGISYFTAISARGRELREPNENIDRTKHQVFVSSAILGFTWLHPLSAIYISPEIHLSQQGRRLVSQKVRENSSEITTKQSISYSSRLGGALNVGRDYWLNHRIAMGFVFSLIHNGLLVESLDEKITETGAASAISQSTTQLQRNNAKQWTYGIGMSIFIN